MTSNIIIAIRGTIANYVGKKRWVGSSKILPFCQHLQGRKCQLSGGVGPWVGIVKNVICFVPRTAVPKKLSILYFFLFRFHPLFGDHNIDLILKDGQKWVEINAMSLIQGKARNVDIEHNKHAIFPSPKFQTHLEIISIVSSLIHEVLICHMHFRAALEIRVHGC